MKFNKYIGWAVFSLLMTACQSDEIEVDKPQDGGLMTVIGQIAGEVEGRAQILFGNQELYREYFFWNEGDSFNFYQKKDNQLVANEFAISENYNETNGAAENAEFTTTAELTPSTSYVAVYPHTVTLDGNDINFNLQTELDFTSATTEEDINNVWKDYFNNNMIMIASGTLSESGRNYIKFNHQCALARITYTNQTGTSKQITGIRLGGNQFFSGSMTYNVAENYQSGSSKGNNYEVLMKGLNVDAGKSVDLYVLFFPTNFEEGNMDIRIMHPDGYKIISLPISDLKSANGEGFRAGMRCWFDITETQDGLVWTKNLATEGWIVFENKDFSKILYDMLGNYKVSINDEGCAVMSEEHVLAQYQLDFTNVQDSISLLEGIEKFVNLQTLKCNDKGLTEIDLSALGQLLEVDLSGNKLTELDLTNNQRITKLDCHGNYLSELDVTPLTTIAYRGDGALICGSQKNGITLELVMTPEQRNKWENNWSKDSLNVDVYYDSVENEMKKVAKNGGSFTLSEYLRLTSPLIVEKDFTLTFSNGAFDGDEGQFVDHDSLKAMVVVKPGATFTYNGDGYFNTGHKTTQITCIRMMGGSDAPSKVVINNGSLIGTYHTILIDEDCQNAEVEINGGSMSCDWWSEFKGVAIFNKSNAKITINGGNFGDSTSAIEMWGGELNISEGYFNTNLSEQHEGIGANPVVGNTLMGPAISIAPKQDVKVNISGGNFNGTGIASFYETIIANNVDPDVSISITGGVFNSGVWSNNCTGFISGGQYLVRPEARFIADGMTAVGNGKYYVIQSAVNDGTANGSDFNNGGEF